MILCPCALPGGPHGHGDDGAASALGRGPDPRRTPDGRRRRAGLQRGGGAGAERRASAPLPDVALPVQLADHHRRQRVDRPHRRHRFRAGRACSTACGSSTSTARVAAWPCARPGRAATPRCSPTPTSISRPGSTPSCRWWPRWCRGTRTSPSAAAWRPAPTWCAARGARPSRGPTTSSCARCSPTASVTRSAASRRCARMWPVGLVPGDRRRRLVLRHRAAAAGRAQRPAHPRGAGRLGRRSRQPRGRRPHRPGRPAGRGAHGVALRQGRRLARLRR